MKKSHVIWLFAVFIFLFGAMGFLSWRNPYVVNIESGSGFLPGFLPTIIGIVIISIAALLILISEN